MSGTKAAKRGKENAPLRAEQHATDDFDDSRSYHRFQSLTEDLEKTSKRKSSKVLQAATADLNASQENLVTVSNHCEVASKIDNRFLRSEIE